ARAEDAVASAPNMPDVHYYSLESGSRVLRLCGRRLEGVFELGFSASDGMASNLALALLAAHACGIDADALRQRIRNWQPADQRGQWQRFASRPQAVYF